MLYTPDGQEDRIGTFFNGAFATKDVEKTYRELKEIPVRPPGPGLRPGGGVAPVNIRPDSA